MSDRTNDPLGGSPLNTASSKPFVIVLVCILVLIMLSILYLVVKRWQDEKREERWRQASLTIHTTAVTVDPMSEIFFNNSTTSVTDIRPPPPVYTAKDQHLEFSNCPPPPPFSVSVSIDPVPSPSPRPPPSPPPSPSRSSSNRFPADRMYPSLGE